MWLQHLRHLTLTNQQRHSIATHAKRHMGLAHTRLGSVRQSVVHQAVRRDVGVGMGQVTQTTHHIGLGSPMWGRESDPGPREFSRGSGPGGIGPVAGPFWCRLRHGWLLVSVSDQRPVCVSTSPCSNVEHITRSNNHPIPGEAGCRGVGTRQVYRC